MSGWGPDAEGGMGVVLSWECLGGRLAVVDSRGDG